MAVNISLKNIKLKSFSLHNITFKNVEEKELVNLYEMVSDQLYEIQASVITATLIGDRSAIKIVKKASKKVFDEINWPVLWIGDQENTKFSGNFIAVSGVNMKTFCGNGFTTKYFETPNTKYCYVGEVVYNSLQASEDVNTLICKALNLVEVSTESIVRTWNYFESEMLNTANWKNMLKYSSNQNSVNTIIGSANQYKKAGITSVLAVQQKEKPLKIDFTIDRSNEKHTIQIVDENSKTLFISGVAECMHNDNVSLIDNIEFEIKQCIAKIEEILLVKKSTWHDLFRGVAYFRNLNDASVFKKICKEKKIPLSPIVLVQVNYIQNKLRFDLETDFVSYNEE